VRVGARVWVFLSATGSVVSVDVYLAIVILTRPVSMLVVDAWVRSR
jgi:hypothetical protein